MSTQRTPTRHRPGHSPSGRHRAAQRPRTLHLLDVENLVGGEVTPDRCRALWTRYRQIVGLEPEDHVVAAVADRNAEAALFAIARPVQWLIPRFAPDAADKALTEAVDPTYTARRFQRVVIGSGNHHFTDLAAQLTALDIEVHQAVGAGRCSSHLYQACHHSFSLTPRVQTQAAA